MIEVRKEFIEFETYKVQQVRIGEGKPVLLMLGWMANINQFPFQKALSQSEAYLEKYQLIVPHLPNFNESSMTEKSLDLFGYSEIMSKYLKAQEIENLDIIGHSNGARFAIRYTLDNPEQINSLTLLSAAGLSHKNATQKMIDRAKYSFYKFTASGDDEAILKETYRNLHDSSLENEIPNIKNETLIIWGDQDKVIKPRRLSQFQTLIPHAESIMLAGVDHMVTYDPRTFLEIFKFIDSNFANQIKFEGPSANS